MNITPVVKEGDFFAAGHCTEHLDFDFFFIFFCLPPLIESNTEYPESVTVTARYIGA